MQQRFVQIKLRYDKVRCTSRSIPEYVCEVSCRNKICACDAAFVSSKISGILEIVAIGLVPALRTEIRCATKVRAHKASHVNEDIRQTSIPMKKKGEHASKHSLQNVALRGQGAEQILPSLL